jgi:hypothetical protein
VAAFYFNEGEMDVPQKWEDKTVNGFSFPAGSKRPSASFAITRDPLRPDHSLAAYVDKQLVDMAKACPRFELLRRDDLTLDGEPAVQVAFTWRTPDGIIVQQEQTILRLPTQIFLTMTATAPRDKFKEHLATFRSFVQSFRLRREA